MGRPQSQGLLYIGLIITCIVAFIYLRYARERVEGFEGPQLFDIPFYTLRKKNDIPTIVAGVPLVLYQSWHINRVPVKMRETIYKLLDKNPEFDYYLYSDEKSLEFIKENYDDEVVDAFNTLKPGAYKSDLWRYCILYKNGGVYVDIKFYSLIPLINVVRRSPTIYVKDLPAPCKGIYNAFMSSPPNNIIFKKCIDDIVNSCKLKLYKRNSLDITGPCLLGDILNTSNIPISNDFKLEWSQPSEKVTYKGVVILKAYPEYRSEQHAFQKSPRYGILWENRDVYV